MAPLDVFSSTTRAWFERTFDGPTPAQEKGWPVIASGAHTLINAVAFCALMAAYQLVAMSGFIGRTGTDEAQPLGAPSYR